MQARSRERVLGLALEHVDDVGGVEGGGDVGAEVDHRDRVDLGVLLGEASDLRQASKPASLPSMPTTMRLKIDPPIVVPELCLLGVPFGFISDLPSRVPAARWE